MKLKLWKIKIFLIFYAKYFLNIVHSIIVLFLLKIKKNQLKIKKNKKILIVGSGSTIDNIDFTKVKNCSVILLNNSWQLSKKFYPNSNDIYFFCASSTVLNTIAHELPNNINKIFLCDLLKLNLKSLEVIFKKNTNLYLPQFYNKFFNFKRKIFKTKEMNLDYGLFKIGLQRISSEFLNKNKIYPMPYTVLYSALIFFSKLNPEYIITVGFDGTFNTIDNHSSLLDISSYEKKYGKSNSQFNYERRKSKITLWNYSINRILLNTGIKWHDFNYLSKSSHPNRIDIYKFYDIFRNDKIS